MTNETEPAVTGDKCAKHMTTYIQGRYNNAGNYAKNRNRDNRLSITG